MSGEGWNPITELPLGESLKVEFKSDRKQLHDDESGGSAGLPRQ